MIGAVADFILGLPAWVAVLFVFLLPALESSAFVGFVFPGEIALILGGVLAYEGRVPLAAVLVAGVLGAIIGDSVGYVVGRRYGRRVLDGTLGRWVKKDHFDRAEVYLAERGGKAVFLGRFTAALRVMIPGLAGMSRLRYRVFLMYNVAGAVGWVTMSVLLGYIGGSSWHRVEHIASRIGLGALALLVLMVGAGLLVRRLGPAPLQRLGRQVADSPPVRRLRRRYPRSAAWTGRRLDPSSVTGLGLTVAVVVGVGATWTFLGVTQDVVAHEELSLWDPRVHSWVLDHRTAFLDTFFRVVTWLGASAVTVPLLVIAGGLIARWRRSWGPLVQIAAVYGVAVILHAVVAQLVQRPRPPRADWLMGASGWAYPSGHTTQAMAAWGVLALLLAAHAAWRVRVALVAGASVVVLLVAVSRVYLGVHWFTDVLGALTMAAAVIAWWEFGRRAVFTSGPATPPPSGGVVDDRPTSVVPR